MYAVSLISIYKDSNWKVGKIILRYIAGMEDYGIWYSTSKDNSLVGYKDNDFARNNDDRKTNSTYAFHFSIGLISWASKKHTIATIS
jgi:hypothetical protein